MWKYYALLAAFCAALTAIFSKMGVKDINPDLATAIRTSFVLLVVWGMVFFANATRDFSRLSVSSLIFLLLSAISTGLSWIFYFRALHTGEVAKVAPIDKLSVPITMLLAFIFLGEKITLKVLAGGALITLGTLLMLL